MQELVKKNIFDEPDMKSSGQEILESLVNGEQIKIERIFTQKPVSAPGKWYDQESDEWVILLQGKASLEFNNKTIIHLIAGDYLFIPSHKKHRIIRTSSDPCCLWLAVHGKLK